MRDFYSIIAPFYDGVVGPFLRTARNDIRRAVSDLECRAVLEVACGTGEQAIMLAKKGLNVTGIDLSPAMLEIARLKSPPGLPFVLGDAGCMPFESATFDCVGVSLALHEMDAGTRSSTMREMLRVLAPGGVVMVLDYAGLNRGWRSDLGLSLLGLAEKIAGGEHFRNFVRFIHGGGIEGLLEQFPVRTIEERSYFLGGLRLIVSKKAF